MYRSRGFSLLELMVVLVVLALCSAIALPRLFAADSHGSLHAQGDELAAVLHDLSDGAVLAGHALGLHVDDYGYQVLQRAGGDWQVMHVQSLPGTGSAQADAPTLRLVAGECLRRIDNAVQIVVTAAGLATSCRIELASRSQMIEVEMDAAGNVSKRPKDAI
ncbi:MAG: prepilin-type N-terminal cleavage/methylation domain-containing protein [Gammaproteobacteria bacterium]|nr:prepilin-type N-terminal cleavage/methylation domain-containing protein [Gammaproteobacteria bacterium]